MRTKVIVITGGNSGIGEAIAEKLAKQKRTLILIARNKKSLSWVKKRLQKKTKARVLAFDVDLRRLRAVGELISKIRKAVRQIDVLVNAAGVYHDEKKAFYQINFPQYSREEVLSPLQVGIIAPILLAHGLVPLMRKGSKIVNISGTFESGAKGWLPYYLSKKALEDFTIGLAQELRQKRIQVNCISPSDTLTPAYQKFFPKYAKPKLCLQPKEVARLAEFLTSKGADHLTGQVIEIKQKRVGE